MKIEIGRYVRIASDYPTNRNFQSQTGYIIALPNAEHPNEYLVKLDGGTFSQKHNDIIPGTSVGVSISGHSPQAAGN
jgi:hypothetical protein